MFNVTKDALCTGQPPSAAALSVPKCSASLQGSKRQAKRNCSESGENIGYSFKIATVCLRKPRNDTSELYCCLHLPVIGFAMADPRLADSKSSKFFRSAASGRPFHAERPCRRGTSLLLRDCTRCNSRSMFGSFRCRSHS